MKKALILVTLYILIVAAATGVNIARINHMQELATQQKIRDIKQDRKIEALEKELRLLKTDVNILQYGFEEKEND